ncbi:hypothetical protein D3C87_2198580 [compost metagenome]
MQQRRVGTDSQDPLLFGITQGFGAAEQFAFAGRAIVDFFHQARLLDCLDGVGGDGGELEL